LCALSGCAPFNVAGVFRPTHLQPTAPLADRVLLPGDPGRALLLAQAVLAEPKMFNHSRGLWGYTGPASDGLPMTIQSTGIGGPSAAIVIAELVGLGAKRLLRVGTCRSLARTLALGDLVVATRAIGEDGTSRALGAPHVRAAYPDPGLTRGLTASAEATAVTVVSTDLVYDVPAAEPRRWRDAGAAAVDMETATLFSLAARHDLTAASIMTVAETLAPTRVRIDPDRLREAELRMGALAAAALSSAPAAPGRPRSVPAAPR
jgi:uridine phosphorylase